MPDILLEYKLILFFCKNVGKVLTYNRITQEIWGVGHDSLETLRVFVTSIRKKIETIDTEHKYIQTHVGIGYRMIKLDKS